MQKANELPERIDRLRESADADAQRIGQAAYFAGIERYLPLLHPDAGTAADYLPADMLVVLDEPANGLDSEGLERLAEVIAAARSAKRAILAASHQPIGLGDHHIVKLG